MATLRLEVMVLVTLATTQVTLPLAPSRSRVVDLNSFTPLDSIPTSSTLGGGDGESGGHDAHFPFDIRNYYNKGAAVDDRKHRQLTSNLLQAASSDYGTGDMDFGNFASAGAYGGGGHGGGHGGGGYGEGSHGGGGHGGGKGGGYESGGYGWGTKSHGHGGHDHGHDHGPKKKDCNSAIGLLGTLGLIAFLTAVLRGLNIPPMPGAQQGVAQRTRRGTAEAEDDLNDLSHRITRLMLPLMIRVGQARDGGIPSACTIHEVCRANRILVKEIGEEGRYLGTMLTKAISKMLGEVAPSKGSATTSSIETQVGDAARSGRSDLDCDLLYTTCRGLPPADVPQFLTILKSPLGQAYTSKYSTAT